jgi:hypothetical protein
VSTYVDVPADALLSFLAGKGFSERTSPGDEIVYARAHGVDGRYKIVIYTSIRRGAADARSCGKDAIRVCGIFEDAEGSFGVVKLPRVHRTGSVEAVLERTIERAREAYASITRRIRDKRGTSHGS